jgi:hypothetical protein
MPSKLIDMLFGCKHQFTFPIRPEGDEKAYQVCTQCGAEYEYDWRTMRRLGPMQRKPTAVRLPDVPQVA